MQNRLVIRGIPSSVSNLPHSAENLRDLVEENGCWVDRFAFLPNEDDSESSPTVAAGAGTVLAAAELHIENVRDRAVNALNGMSVVLRRDGSLANKGSDGDDDDYDVTSKSMREGSNITITDREDCNNDFITFTINASPANFKQSKLLVEKCPIDHDDEESDETDLNARKMEQMKLQKWILPNGSELSVRRSEESGGTGTDPWRGGVILAEQISSWFAKEEPDGAISTMPPSENGSKGSAESGMTTAGFSLSRKILFDDKVVLELGAGSAGLPSMVLALTCNVNQPITGDSIDDSKSQVSCRPQSIVATDGVDEIVRGLKKNVVANNLHDLVSVKHLDWNQLSTRHQNSKCEPAGVPLDCIDANSLAPPLADTIIFADCVYNEEGALALCNAIDATLKPGGNIIGVLPDYRVGLDLFERTMVRRGYIPRLIPRSSFPSTKKCMGEKSFLCSGGGGKNYRMLWWRRENTRSI